MPETLQDMNAPKDKMEKHNALVAECETGIEEAKLTLLDSNKVVCKD